MLCELTRKFEDLVSKLVSDAPGHSYCLRLGSISLLSCDSSTTYKIIH